MYLDISTLLEQLNKVDTGHHLILTGSIGSGKTTLLNAYLKNKKNFFHITTKVTSNHQKIIAKIGHKHLELAHFNHGFLINRLSFFEMMRIIEQERKNHALLIIDEIGHLEYQMIEYIEYLVRISKDTRLILVVRKNECPLWDYIEELEDPIIFDLDQIYEKADYASPHR